MNSSKNALMDINQMLTQNTQKPTSFPYFDLLSLILVILKGLGYISCNWIIPFIPLCIPVVFYLIVVSIGFCVKKFFKK